MRPCRYSSFFVFFGGVGVDGQRCLGWAAGKSLRRPGGLGAIDDAAPYVGIADGMSSAHGKKMLLRGSQRALPPREVFPSGWPRGPLGCQQARPHRRGHLVQKPRNKTRLYRHGHGATGCWKALGRGRVVMSTRLAYTHEVGMSSAMADIVHAPWVPAGSGSSRGYR